MKTVGWWCAAWLEPKTCHRACHIFLFLLWLQYLQSGADHIMRSCSGWVMWCFELAHLRLFAWWVVKSMLFLNFTNSVFRCSLCCLMISCEFLWVTLHFGILIQNIIWPSPQTEHVVANDSLKLNLDLIQICGISLTSNISSQGRHAAAQVKLICFDFNVWNGSFKKMRELSCKLSSEIL